MNTRDVHLWLGCFSWRCWPRFFCHSGAVALLRMIVSSGLSLRAGTYGIFGDRGGMSLDLPEGVGARRYTERKPFGRGRSDDHEVAPNPHRRSPVGRKVFSPEGRWVPAGVIARSRKPPLSVLAPSLSFWDPLPIGWLESVGTPFV